MWIEKNGRQAWIDGNQFNGANLLPLIAEKQRVRKEVLEQMFEMVKSGMTPNAIKKEIHKQEGISIKTLHNYMVAVNKMLDGYVERDISYVIALHLQRYENIYNETLEMIDDLEMDDVELFYKVAPIKYGEMLQALSQKESLMGLHQKRKSIEVPETDLIRVVVESDIFNTDKLTLKEKVELKDLLFECKVDKEDGIQKLLVKPKTEVIEAEVISEEEDDSKVPLPETPIKLIGHDKRAEKDKVKVHPIDKLREKEGKTLDELHKEIKKSQEEQFRKLLGK